MEPAVFGQPVIFGPVNSNSFEAGELMKTGSAFAVENAAQIEEILEKLVTNDLYRSEIGSKAKNLIYNNLGATERIYNHLKQNYGFIS